MENTKQDWGYDESQKENVSVSEVDTIMADYEKADLEVKGIKAELKAANERLAELETKLLAFLSSTERKNYSSAVGLATRVQRYSLQIPKTKEAKEEFFKFLENEGLFWDKVNINSQSLQGLYSEECSRAESEGRLPTQFPGIGLPTMSEYIQFRRSK